jgi:uncharacterized protein YcnI/copper(I)-binding protein
MRDFAMTTARSFALACLAGALLTASASAHVSLERREATAGSSYKAVLTVPHGCGAEPTTAIRVQIPEGVHSVRPQPKPGWTLATTVRPYGRAYTNHGREVREGVVEIVWSGGSLASEHYDEFVFVGQIDTSLAGAGRVHFPVVQTCAKGEARWVEVPQAGSNARLQSPAPALRIVAASGERPAAAASPAIVEVGSLKIAQAWSRATPGGARVAGGYLSVTNTGNEPERLTGGSAAFAERVEIHEMATVNGVMTMRGLAGGLVIAPGQTVELKPGGLHVMFMGLRQPLAQGQSVKVRLTFERAGPVEVEFRIGTVGGRAAPADDHSHH